MVQSGAGRGWRLCGRRGRRGRRSWRGWWCLMRRLRWRWWIWGFETSLWEGCCEASERVVMDGFGQLAMGKSWMGTIGGIV